MCVRVCRPTVLGSAAEMREIFLSLKNVEERAALQDAGRRWGYARAKMKTGQIFRNFFDSLQWRGSEGKRGEAIDALKEERMALPGGARGRSHTASRACHTT